MSGEELHKLLDQIEEIHGLYSPTAFGNGSSIGMRWIYISAWRWID